MVSAPTKKPATYEDLLALPEHVVGEIIDGDLIVSPRPSSPHAVASSFLGTDLIGPFGRKPGGTSGPGGWHILFEPELHIGPNVLVPDLAGWRRERMPAVPDVPAFELSPDWLCEVLSPSTEAVDRARKMRQYHRFGVVHVWLLNPRARTLEVYRRAEAVWELVVTHDGDVKVRVEPFDAIELDLSRFWMESATAP